MSVNQNANAQTNSVSGDRPVSDGQTATQRPVIKVDPANVPPEIHYLIPYAEKWGVTDSALLQLLLNEAPLPELEDLKSVVLPVLMNIVKAENFPPMEDTPEAAVFDALISASVGAGRLLYKERQRNQPPSETKPYVYIPHHYWTHPQRGEQRLERIDWPETVPPHKLDPAKVPPILHPIIPYAEKWGIWNRERQDALLRQASLAELEELYTVLSPILNDLVRFVISVPSLDAPGDEEIGVFDALWTAFREATGRLGDEMPKRQWLTMVGWPEKYRGPKLDPAKVPPELHPLIPLVEKWAGEDDYIRSCAIEMAETDELKEFLLTVNMVGNETFRRQSLKMTYDETRAAEGYSLLTLLELVDDADRQLRYRGVSVAGGNVESE